MTTEYFTILQTLLGSSLKLGDTYTPWHVGEESHCVQDAKISLTSDFLQDKIEEMLQDFYTTPQVKHVIPAVHSGNGVFGANL